MFNKGNKFKTFNDYLNTLKNNIQIICFGIDARTDNRIEYDDLFQEAVLKLLQIYKNNEPLDVNFSKKRIRDYLIDYVRKTTKGNIVDFDINNLLYSCNEREYDK